MSGHSTNKYMALKSKIHHLIKNGWIKLKKLNYPLNVNPNPLPNHNNRGNRGVNMIDDWENQAVADIHKIQTLMEQNFEMLFIARYVKAMALRLGMSVIDKEKRYRYRWEMTRNNAD